MCQTQLEGVLWVPGDEEEHTLVLRLQPIQIAHSPNPLSAARTNTSCQSTEGLLLCFDREEEALEEEDTDESGLCRVSGLSLIEGICRYPSSSSRIPLVEPLVFIRCCCSRCNCCCCSRSRNMTSNKRSN